MRHFLASVVCLAAATLIGCNQSSDLPESPSESGAPTKTGTPADETSTTDTQKTGMLRHAVFFAFKDESTPEQVQEVVDAFAALPSKIDAITDFQYGINNSPEGFNDGFTHCFLLTFADDAGRKTYLPHPAHKAFGDALRPHMKDVFVIDYWGDPSQQHPEKALQHAVFFQFKADADPAKIKEVEDAFAALPGKIDAIKAFEWGQNNSPEKHDDGFTHAFLVTFDSKKGRETYLPHPDHEAFVKLIGPVLERPRVLDFWALKPGDENAPAAE